MEEIIKLFLICTVVLTITTKIGFVIQGTYFDIRGVLLCASLAMLTVFVAMGFKILGILIAYILYINLLCKVGEIELCPDAILASVIGCSAFGMIMFNKISELGIVLF